MNFLKRIVRINDPSYDDHENLSRRKTKFELIRIALIVCGIELCYAAETALVTPLLLELGIPVEYMSLVWGLSPFFGFILAFSLGTLSDTCKSKLGKRRPFILLHSIGIILGLLLVAFSNLVTVIKRFYIFLTILGVFLLDFNCDACQNPSRAYLIDICVTDDHSNGLAIFTMMAGLGGCLGYLIDAIAWKKFSVFGVNSLSTDVNHVQIIFSIVLVVFVFCSVSTLASFKEIPLNSHTYADLDRSNTNLNEGFVSKIKRQLRLLAATPKHILILCVTNFFSWISLVCYSLYFTDFVAQTIYGGVPDRSKGAAYDRYEEGVRFGSLCMALYSISCSFYSFSYDRLLKRFQLKYIYILGQLAYSLGMLTLGLTQNKIVAVLVSPTAGVMYSTLFTVPYIILSKYHSNENNKNVAGCIGQEISLVGSMVFVAQFVLSLIIGFVVKFLHTNVVIIYLASIFAFCASVTANFIRYEC